MPNPTLHLERPHERLELDDTDLINREFHLDRVHAHAVDIVDIEG
jgi:hypothetical protein